MVIKTLNQSYTQIKFSEDPKSQSTLNTLKQILQVERNGWQYDYLVKIGRKSKYDVYYEQTPDGSLIVDSGILEIPAVREVLELPELKYETNNEVVEFVESIVNSNTLPFDPYEYQTQSVVKALSKQRKLSLMCTGSGKSLTISLCLEYFRRQNLKGVLVVPNINLLTQFASDIKSYNLHELHSRIITFGGGSKSLKALNESQTINPGDLIITTWQSLSKLNPKFFNEIDYIVCDEVHKFSSECTSNLVQQTMHAKYKLGFTGTLPDAKGHKMTLIGLFGVPELIISSDDLIKMGRGTPIHVTGVKLKHSGENSAEVSKFGEYLDKVKFTVSIPERTQIIANLARSASSQGKGSTLVLFTFTEHGEQIYKAIAGCDVPDLQTMQQTGVYFMTGQTTGKEREQIRLLMDKDPKAILVANYALLSTGVNIKSLRYAVFAHPIKSGVTVNQSLGRGIRLNDGKEKFEVYDIVDSFGGTGMFVRQYNVRKKHYQKSNFSLSERVEVL